MATILSPFLASSPKQEHLESLLPWQGEPLSTILLVYLLRTSLVNPKPPASSRDVLQHPGGIKRKGQQPLLLVKNSTHASANRQ